MINVEVSEMAREKTLAKREQTELESWDPYDSFREMERMFRDFLVSPFYLMRRGFRMRPIITEYTPEVDLRETESELVLSATVPGLEKDDIDIDVQTDRITVSGERKIEEEKPGESYHIRHQGYGSFSISYMLPVEVKPDEVKATYKNGVLDVIMPKAEVKEAHKVKVESE